MYGRSEDYRLSFDLDAVRKATWRRWCCRGNDYDDGDDDDEGGVNDDDGVNHDDGIDDDVDDGNDDIVVDESGVDDENDDGVKDEGGVDDVDEDVINRTMSRLHVLISHDHSVRIDDRFATVFAMPAEDILDASVIDAYGNLGMPPTTFARSKILIFVIWGQLWGK